MALLSASLLTLTSRSSVRLAASTPHHRSPTSAIRPAGQDLGAPSAPGIDDTTAPIAAECQSFLDHVISQFGASLAQCDQHVRASAYRGASDPFILIVE